MTNPYHGEPSLLLFRLIIFSFPTAHPNVKVFLTHGGPRSLEEALFYEVPILGFPTIKSRKIFIGEITKFGAGEIVDPYSFDKGAFKATISAVATDKK